MPSQRVSSTSSSGYDRAQALSYPRRSQEDVFDYIKMFYNRKRKHVRNGMLSPAELERQ